MEPRMLCHPVPRLSTVMTAEIIGDDEDIAGRIVGFDILEQSDVVGRVTRSGTPGQFLTVTHAQGSIHPGFFGATAVIQWRFDTMAVGRPGRGRGESAGHYWPQFVGADGR